MALDLLANQAQPSIEHSCHCNFKVLSSSDTSAVSDATAAEAFEDYRLNSHSECDI